MSTASTLGSRLVRAAMMDSGVYEEVEADSTANVQALVVIVASAVAAGLGSGDSSTLVPMTLTALLGWFLWAVATYLIGTKLLPEAETRSNVGEMLRVTGFSSAPGLVRILGIVRMLNAPIFILTGIWMLFTMIVAIRQALDYKSTMRAVFVALLGWLVFFGIGVVAGGFVSTGL